MANEVQERFPDPNDPAMRGPQRNPLLMDPNLGPSSAQAQVPDLGGAGTRTSTQAYLDTLGPPQSDEDIMRQIGGIEEKRGKVESDAAGRMESRLAGADAMLASPIRPPTPPKLQDIPKRPNLQYRDAMQTFQSPAVLLATLGSLFTRRSAVNALTAGAGALNGFMEGDEKRVQLEEKNWKNAVEETVKQNEVEMKEFDAVFKNTELAERDRNARLLGIFSANRDEIGLATLKTGSMERLEQLHAARLKGNEVLRNSLVKAQTADDRRAQGLLAPEDYQVRAAQALQGDYKGAFQNLGFGMQRAENMRGILAAARAQRPDLSPEELGKLMAAANQTYAASTSAMRTVTSRVKNLEAIENELLEQMPAAKASSEKLPRGKFVPLNKLIQEGKIITSDPAMYDFATRNLQIAELWARSYNPTGVMRLEDRNLALSRLSTATSKEAWNTVVNAIESGVKANIRGANKTLNNFRSQGIEEVPTSADSPRPRAVNPKTGQAVDWDGSKWVDPITGEAVK